jgi:DNA-binding MarR family transcriptional regulator
MADTTASSPQATDVSQRILPLLERLVRVGRRTADTCMSGCLRPRHLIALQLLAEHGPMTQHTVGTALSLDPSNVVGLLNELEERGLLTRRRDPADRRRHIVELSPAGADELAQTFSRLGLVEDDLFKSLTAQERATLHSLLARAVGSLSVDPAECAAALPDPCTTADDVACQTADPGC